MIDVYEIIKTKTKLERQYHVNLSEPCLERGGCSTNHKGVLAQYLNTNIPHKIVFLCHACHNGKCSNPKHLYWGTPKENFEDAIQNGRKFIVTDEHKRKISSTKKEKARIKRLNNPIYVHPSFGGAKNSQFGTCWITNGKENKRIKKEKLDDYIILGYYKGRII